jgi:hypothetical protein
VLRFCTVGLSDAPLFRVDRDDDKLKCNICAGRIEANLDSKAAARFFERCEIRHGSP